MKANHAVVLRRNGGPEVLSFEAVPDLRVGSGEVRIRQIAIGLNFIDIHHRTGRYPSRSFPVIPGVEAAGFIEEAGSDVRDISVGDRVVYLDQGPGAYTERRVISADRVIKLPDGLESETAVAVMLKGLTAHSMVRGAYQVQAGETILVHAAAGGVGLVLCQLAKHRGARVIGTAGTAEKATLAREHGCDEVILYCDEDVVARVRDLTGGAGVDAVFDGVGASTFESSLSSLRRRGTLVSYGTASGPIPPFDIFRLNQMGSLHLTSVSAMDYTRAHPEYVARVEELFGAVMRGLVHVNLLQRYRLRDAAQAHRDLEARRTVGSSILLTGG